MLNTIISRIDHTTFRSSMKQWVGCSDTGRGTTDRGLRNQARRSGGTHNRRPGHTFGDIHLLGPVGPGGGCFC
jgi:hypothetical protein